LICEFSKDILWNIILVIIDLHYVIPACPESFLRKDSRRASLAGMTDLIFVNKKAAKLKASAAGYSSKTSKNQVYYGTNGKQKSTFLYLLPLKP
jgi:hypothetical protein